MDRHSELGHWCVECDRKLNQGIANMSFVGSREEWMSRRMTDVEVESLAFSSRLKKLEELMMLKRPESQEVQLPRNQSTPQVKEERCSWEDYFLNIAAQVATRSTCPRASVGAVIVHDRRILVTGYNGSLPGERHCVGEGSVEGTTAGCLMENGHCVRTVHAEVNAVAQAAKLGISIDGASLFCTHQPCPNCTKTLIAAGVRGPFFFRKAYP